MYYLMEKINLLLENFNNEQNYVWVFLWEVISCKLSFPEVWSYWWQLLFSGEFPSKQPAMPHCSRSGMEGESGLWHL